MALERPEAHQRPEVEALGLLDLGAFAGHAFLTPVKVLQLQRAEATA
ncbi:MAG: hypothetical protein Q8N13_23870 [Acidovorax sp.]|nr:hypothetical protein [Acidovorax sp.]